ncbi:F-type H+-transporting ATPase subunit delta [Nicoletella semolina]|uniref:ATP synthase subunit delta n=1 Tax=Nicoletella semolina TaxID=271160 RepID=A0A4R2N730_9PAST|nr:F0F1 ATP synthase subunit delta [Nicoletella semolina]MDH2924748.1 ATP F0F1 synthase subunit delta [Nicoletella semolina]TCP16628.1 F-type H+-transporting ATPase subunit delta [Nicoletella semolina]
MSEFTTVARPYAKAAFDFALENGQLDKWQEMLQFSVAVAENEQVAELINSQLASGQIADFFCKIGNEELDQYGQNFIRVMAENKRLSVLPFVLKAFNEFRFAYESTKEIEVVSAAELSEAQKAKVVEAMEKRLNRQVRLISRVDNSLLAGIIIRYDDTVIDGSSRGQLNRLSRELGL